VNQPPAADPAFRFRTVSTFFRTQAMSCCAGSARVASQQAVVDQRPVTHPPAGGSGLRPEKSGPNNETDPSIARYRSGSDAKQTKRTPTTSQWTHVGPRTSLRPATRMALLRRRTITSFATDHVNRKHRQQRIALERFLCDA